MLKQALEAESGCSCLAHLTSLTRGEPADLGAIDRGAVLAEIGVAFGEEL